MFFYTLHWNNIGKHNDCSQFHLRIWIQQSRAHRVVQKLAKHGNYMFDRKNLQNHVFSCRQHQKCSTLHQRQSKF
ncbi:hypothetical protein Hanom_Chr10g00927131 [Helianthus anomalus]